MGVVHQAARLAEVVVFGKLADDGQLDGVEGVSIEEVVEDGCTEDFDGCRRGEPRTLEDPTRCVGLPATDGQSPLLEGEGDAAHECFGGVLLSRDLFKVVEIDLDGGIPLAYQDHPVVIPSAHRSDGVEVDGRGDDTPEVVVGVVAPQFAPAGG